MHAFAVPGCYSQYRDLKRLKKIQLFAHVVDGRTDDLSKGCAMNGM